MKISAYGRGLTSALITEICKIMILFIFRHEKRLWFLTLFLGTCMLYSTRTSMPLLLPAVASELKWSKTESGTVLSSFFWGYTVTQVG